MVLCNKIIIITILNSHRFLFAVDIFTLDSVSCDYMKKFSVSVLLIGDKYVSGVKDESTGKYIVGALPPDVFDCTNYDVIPDDAEAIRNAIMLYADTLQRDVIVTAGGTGLTVTDITPEVTRSLIDKEVPGLAEAMRFEGYKLTHKALLSRGICGIRRKTLIINLPGSSKGALQSLEVILGILPHALGTIQRI